MQQEHERDAERGEEERVGGIGDPDQIGRPIEQVGPHGEHEQDDRDRHPQQRVALGELATPDQLEHREQQHRGHHDRDDLDGGLELALGGDREHGAHRPTAAGPDSSLVAAVAAAGATGWPSGRSGG